VEKKQKAVTTANTETTTDQASVVAAATQNGRGRSYRCVISPGQEKNVFHIDGGSLCMIGKGFQLVRSLFCTREDNTNMKKKLKKNENGKEQNLPIKPETRSFMKKSALLEIVIGGSLSSPAKKTEKKTKQFN
jgi:hypothetical protein